MLQNNCQSSQNCSWKLPDFFHCCGMECGHTRHQLWLHANILCDPMEFASTFRLPH